MGEGIHSLKKPYSGIYSRCRPLYLRQVLSALQPDCLDAEDTSYVKNGRKALTHSRQNELRTISDLRLTEIALQNATAYRQENGTFKEPAKPSLSLESILTRTIIYSGKKWRQETQAAQFNKMWRSLALDVQDRFGKGNGGMFDCSTAKKNVREQEEKKKTYLSASNGSKSSPSSHNAKNSYPGPRYVSRQKRPPKQVLPRIVVSL